MNRRPKGHSQWSQRSLTVKGSLFWSLPPPKPRLSRDSLSVGASARAIYELAQLRGYSLIHCFHTDLLFVKSKLAARYGFTSLPLGSVILYGNIYAFTGYDGSLHAYTQLDSIRPGIICPWVGQLTKSSSSLQPLPSSLIFFPDSASDSAPAILRKVKLLLRKLYLRLLSK